MNNQNKYPQTLSAQLVAEYDIFDERIAGDLAPNIVRNELVKAGYDVTVELGGGGQTILTAPAFTTPNGRRTQIIYSSYSWTGLHLEVESEGIYDLEPWCPQLDFQEAYGTLEQKVATFLTDLELVRERMSNTDTRDLHRAIDKEIDDAQAIFDDYAQMPEGTERDYYLRYWAGYLDGLNNAANIFTGMESN